MKALVPAYKQVGERRYREISGLYYEDFEPGDVFEHRPGRTILDVDNTYFTLLTLNVQELHFDAAYAAKTEWKKPLVDSTFTLALLGRCREPPRFCGAVHAAAVDDHRDQDPHSGTTQRSGRHGYGPELPVGC